VTGDIDEAYLDRLEASRNSSAARGDQAQNDDPRTQLHLQRSAVNE
jgi:amidophosphoribosyltransferase